MGLVHPKSLAATVDAVNEVLFFSWPLRVAEKTQAARWIASRQGLPGSYAGMPAPTELDFATGLRVFTGERMRSGGGLAHVLGEEACRALRALGPSSVATREALERAEAGMALRLQRDRYATTGRYCCYTCSVALWRNLAGGGLGGGEELLAAGLRHLRDFRDGKGRWRGFPFWYTVLSLSEMSVAAAADELEYATRVLQRPLRGTREGDQYATRRRVLAQRVLGRLGISLSQTERHGSPPKE
ncbi:MAG: hypothetical protein HPY69_16610 [Armatimonadetes bacterium]|nr:hypothetical protein [Armatimonadota bacterium]